jgi:RND family efflux transporter MFP subunit
MGSLFMLLAGCGQGEPAPAAKSSTGAETAVRVPVRQPERKNLVRTVVLPAQFEAYFEAPLLAKVTGYVRQVRVDIGDRVRGPHPGDSGQVIPGDLLVEIEVPELVNELAQRKAAVSKAKAVVSQCEAAIKVAKAAFQSASAEIAEVKSAVDAEKALRTKWKSESGRVSELAASGAVTRKAADESASQLQSSEATVRQAEAKVASAQARLAEAAADVEKSETDLGAAKAEVEVAGAEHARAETMISFCQLRAPFDGVVTMRSVHPGHLATASTNKPLLVVSRIDLLRLVSQVPEKDALLVHPGCKSTLRIPSLPGTLMTGQITRTSESLDPSNRTVTAEIDVPNPDATLKPGTYVQVEIEVARRENAITLPTTAIINQAQQRCCLIVSEESKVVMKPVQLGIQSGPDVEIVSGLTGSEFVIWANVAGFRDGQVVDSVRPSGSK